jgi:hypothetical protein
MIVETHNNLGDPHKLEATRALVSAEDGTPICLVVEYARHPKPWFRVFRAGDKDFNDRLREHGVDRTVLVTHVDPKKLRGDGPPLQLG